MQTKTFKVPNISCGHYVDTVQNEVGELAGIKKVVASEEIKNGHGRVGRINPVLG